MRVVVVVTGISCVCSAYLCRRQLLPGGLHPWTRFDGSVGRVVVVLAPLHVNGVGVGRPVACDALVCSGRIKALDCTLSYQRHASDKGSDDEEVSTHRVLLLCGAYLHGRQELTRGFDPPASRW